MSKVYLLFQNIGDGYTYSNENFLGVFSTKEKALEAQIEAEKIVPPSTSDWEAGSYLDYTIEESEIDKLYQEL